MKGLTVKNILIDSAITIALGACQFYGFFILLVSSYGFFLCGNTYLNEWNNIRVGFAISVIIFIAQIVITLYTYKLGTVIIRLSFWAITLSTLFPIVQLGKDTFNYSKYYEEFDSEKWQSADEKPLKMIRVFYKDQRFIGKTREEVIGQLGEGIDSWTIGENELGYTTSGYASPLVFTFKDDTVIHYGLQCYD